MTPAGLARSSLKYYWRTNLAVVLGVATAVAVLGGALLVGESVRASLRQMALDRIGNTHSVVTSATLFREQLAGSMGASVPIIVLEGLVTHQPSGRRATGIQIYAIDDRFFRFHGRQSPLLQAREAAISTALAGELAAKPGETLLLRLEKPTDVPAESLFGRKDDQAPTIRLTTKAVLAGGQMGEFALRPSQGAVRAIFVPLALMQRELNARGRVNTLLLPETAAAPEQLLKSAFALEDLGIRLRALDDRDALQLDTTSGVISDELAQAALETSLQLGFDTNTFFTYLATNLKTGDKSTPYSLIAATDLAGALYKDTPPEARPKFTEDAVVLNDWTARDLGAKVGDALTLEYMVWSADNRIQQDSAPLRVAAIVPMKGFAADRNLTPDYPGITDADNVADWDPPFPMDLNRIRKKDEDYWDDYRTIPKAFVQLSRAQQLWASRWGRLTTIRMAPRGAGAAEELDHALALYRTRLRAKLDPAKLGLVVTPLRQMSLDASRGATDFGEYFTYFSFFLVVSALLLAGLFFRLSVEQRFAEIGLLRAVGFTPGRIKRLFLSEGVLLAVIGAALGIGGAVGYAVLVITGLTTWWVDAVGTRNLSVAVAGGPLVAGALGGLIAAIAAVLLTLRGIRDVTPRGLLASGSGAQKPSRAKAVAIISGMLGLAVLAAGAAKAIPAEAGFFGGAALLLIAALAWFRTQLRVHGRVTGLRGLAFRSAGYRPGRTILSAALIASATFLVVSVESFRRDPHAAASNRDTGAGGYPLIAQSVRPLYYNPETPKGQEQLPDLPPGTTLTGFRLRPGDDASCLNLYEPRNPRIVGVTRAFAEQRRFRFADTGGAANPWMLLFPDPVPGEVPAIADANSLQYVLHKKIGDTIDLPGGKRLKIVASLSDSIFQSELLIGEEAFQRLFPREQGYRVFLIDTSAPGQATVQLENALSDHGFDASATADRLAAFHRVENTYLSTFQTLGALGLLLGTVGLAAVLFRNVLERRRELGLLTALGYTRGDLSRLILFENLILLLAGIGIGVVTALLAIAPVLASRGAPGSILSIGVLLAIVVVSGASAAYIAMRMSLRQRLVESLRAT
ncbi:MAG: FtsX-like permease family protein [Bryobacterales bacterium]|nr:FtsX-like permease family protein [Bryobacterales bacterium]